jgi:phosphoribosylaminoimidazole-succinocarboxamide synthase
MNEKEEQIAKTIEKRRAVLEYKGKSKDVYGLPNGNVLLVFGDAFTGNEDGVEDPGGNINIGKKQGLGHKNLETSAYIFDQVEKHLGIPTQNVHVDLVLDILEAKRATTIGKNCTIMHDGKPLKIDGLEFIARHLAWGSYLKRNPHVKQGDSLLAQNRLLVEVSVKSDIGGDPFFTREQYIDAGILSGEQFDTCVLHTQRISALVTKIFEYADMTLIDMKMEFGIDAKGNILLTDEISAGSLRATISDKLATKDEIYEKLMAHKQGGAK